MVKQTTCCMYLMLITKCTEQLVGVLVGTQNMSDGYSVRVSHQAAYAAQSRSIIGTVHER